MERITLDLVFNALAYGDKIFESPSNLKTKPEPTKTKPESTKTKPGPTLPLRLALAALRAAANRAIKLCASPWHLTPLKACWYFCVFIYALRTKSSSEHLFVGASACQRLDSCKHLVGPISTWKDQNGNIEVQKEYFYCGPSRFWLVLQGTDMSALSVTNWSTKKVLGSCS